MSRHTITKHGRDHRIGGSDPIPFQPISPYSNSVLNSPEGGLILYWKLDELGNTTATAVDSSGNGHSGTYDNGTGLGSSTHPTLGVTGLADQTCASFDGVGDNLTLGNNTSPDLHITGFGTMSVEFWVKTTQTTALDSLSSDTAHVGIVTSDTSSADGRYFRAEMTLATGQMNFVIFDDGATGHSLAGSAVINDGVKHHIVCTFDGTNMDIYVDGVLDTTTAPSMGGQPLATHARFVRVGAGSDGALGPRQSHIHGDVDEVALYTVAISLSTVETHFLIGNVTSGGGGSGTVTSVTAADTSVVVGGTATDPTIRTNTLDVIAADHPPAANWSNNSHKITSLSNGSSAQDAAAFGQIPTALPPNGSAGGDLTGTYPNPTLGTAGPGATGPLGSSSTVPVVTIDAKGRVTALTSATITDVSVTEAPGSDDTATGVHVSLTAGESLAMADPVYFKSDGKVWKADADTAGTFPAMGLAISTASANAAVTILLLGIARHDAWSWTVGGLVYLSTSSGLTQTQPAATDNCIQVIGIATHADRMYVNPQLVYITHT